MLDEAAVGGFVVEVAHDQHLGLPARLDGGQVGTGQDAADRADAQEGGQGLHLGQLGHRDIVVLRTPTAARSRPPCE